MKGKGTNMLRFGMNVQSTTCGVSCDTLRHTFSDVSYYSRLAGFRNGDSVFSWF